MRAPRLLCTAQYDERRDEEGGDAETTQRAKARELADAFSGAQFKLQKLIVGRNDKTALARLVSGISMPHVKVATEAFARADPLNADCELLHQDLDGNEFEDALVWTSADVLAGLPPRAYSMRMERP